MHHSPICSLYRLEYFSPKISAYLGARPFRTDVLVSRDMLEDGLDTVCALEPKKTIKYAQVLWIGSSKTSVFTSSTDRPRCRPHV